MAKTRETGTKAENSAGFKEACLPFLRGLQSIKDNTRYADFTIKRDSRCWKVHKAIICPQSEYFSRACNGDYKEAHSNTITLDDDEDTISSMVHFFYHFDYESSSVIHDILVYIAADKYLILPLRDIALKRFGEIMMAQWCTEGFIAIITAVYGLDAIYKDVFKPLVLGCIGEHRELLREPERYQAFHEALREVEGLAIDVIGVVAVKSGTKYECPNCHAVFSMHTEHSHFHCPKCEDRADNSQARIWGLFEVDA